MTNNICEQTIRNFTIRRKNWQFSTSPKEADISATIYNIIETYKVNSLEPYPYLTYLLKLPNMDFKIHPELPQQVMHWSEQLQNICK